MKIVKDLYSGRKVEVSIAEAVEGSLTETHRDGVAEIANDKAEAVANALAKLIEQLHINKCLTDAQVKEHLGFRHTVQE